MLRGFDAHHDEAQSFQRAYKAGYSFCMLKATQGMTFADRHWEQYSREARAAGLYVAPYHFLRQHEPGSLQAEHFLRTIGYPYPKGLMVPCLDVETFLREPWDLTPYATTMRVLSFVAQVKERIGRGCIIYTSPSFAEEHLTGEILEFGGQRHALAHFPLWVAHYGVSKPRVPKPWTDWTFWQYGETGRVPGLNGGADSTDLDLYNGTSLEWAVYRG